MYVQPKDNLKEGETVSGTEYVDWTFMYVRKQVSCTRPAKSGRDSCGCWLFYC